MSPFTRIGGGEGDSIADTYLSVPTASFVLHTTADFDLFIGGDSGRPPVLYREHSLPFTQEDLNRLRDNNVAELFVKSSDEKNFQRYIASNLSDILKDDTKSAEEKAHLAYFSSQVIVADVFDDPRSKENIQHLKAFVQHMTEYMLQGSTDLQNLMRVMSFDYDTYTHSVNVFVFCIALACECGINDIEALRQLGEGALLHDIGKSLLDPELVSFKGKYSPEQYEQMKQHTVLGFELLESQNAYNPLTLSMVRSHHEKDDGTGYPDGLKGDEINPFVRMCAIAEIFDAITTKKPYKDAETSFAALTEMRKAMLSGTEDRYFRTFVEMLQEEA